MVPCGYRTYGYHRSHLRVIDHIDGGTRADLVDSSSIRKSTDSEMERVTVWDGYDNSPNPVWRLLLRHDWREEKGSRDSEGLIGRSTLREGREESRLVTVDRHLEYRLLGGGGGTGYSLEWRSRGSQSRRLLR